MERMKSINDICIQAERIVDTYFPPIQETKPGSIEDKRIARVYNFVSKAIDNIASVQWERTGGVWHKDWSNDAEKFPRSVYTNPKPKYSYDGAVCEIMETAKRMVL